MLRIANLEEIQRLLLRVPEIVEKLENREPDFSDSVKGWLKEVESVLMNNRLPAAAEAAALRGVLISAERGILPDHAASSGRQTPRKLKDGTAADVLRKCQELVAGEIRGSEARIAEGERLMQQIVAVALRKGLLPAGTISGHTETLQAIWRAISADSELGPLATHVTGLTGATDALVLLDRVLPALS